MHNIIKTKFPTKPLIALAIAAAMMLMGLQSTQLYQADLSSDNSIMISKSKKSGSTIPGGWASS